MAIMITKAQCRAARGLLGWTQSDLASLSGLSKTAIINFERGLTDVKSETLRQIRQAFEQNNIQFGEMDGVQRRADNCRLMPGPDSLFVILREAGSEAEKSKKEILVSFLNEREILQRNLESFYEIARQWESRNITPRYLLGTGEFLFLQPYADYRWLSEDLSRYSITSIIYGNKVALKFWESDYYVLIESPEAAAIERERFEAMWRISTAPSVNKPYNSGSF